MTDKVDEIMNEEGMKSWRNRRLKGMKEECMGEEEDKKEDNKTIWIE